MKPITKLAEPTELTDWKLAFPSAKYTDLSNERSFPGAIKAKSVLRKSLFSEQKGLCCYCECRLSGNDFHIEHFKPKGNPLFAHLQLEYTNLHASCRAQAIGGEDECCGHKKKDQFSANLISPLDIDCDSHFEYNLAGNIIGIDSQGLETVSMLNLDSGLLRSARKSLIEYFEALSDEEYQDEINIHLSDSANPAGEFFTTIQYLHNKNQLH